jgi:hypothetical protein
MIASLMLFAAAFQGAQEITPLSAKAGRLENGLTRSEVIGRLGRPTWAVLPTDTGDFKIPDPSVSLVLIWKNPPCAPVVVDLDRNKKVIGWDEGRAVCGKDVQLLQLEPPTTRSCSLSDRTNFCN